jgi:hypothetical protein
MASKARLPSRDEKCFEPSVNPQDIYLPPLHIRFGLMKIFVKDLNKEGEASTYLRKKFPEIK